ncbi:hypothetical protein CERSUDRAFT_98190 [Gelatoporia subvermispora B]|uniref:Uncharacterized protein n=1 Tax=Ceriporiopsis subvermispora (strain B) TaxID=914234 RepID=M2R3X7_CERS8|nr:hypothetical protein CERSUDRAFT_98190 [Gelatoporia subvermispora B]
MATHGRKYLSVTDLPRKWPYSRDTLRTGCITTSRVFRSWTEAYETASTKQEYHSILVNQHTYKGIVEHFKSTLAPRGLIEFRFADSQPQYLLGPDMFPQSAVRSIVRLWFEKIDIDWLLEKVPAENISCFKEVTHVYLSGSCTHPHKIDMLLGMFPKICHVHLEKLELTEAGRTTITTPGTRAPPFSLHVGAAFTWMFTPYWLNLATLTLLKVPMRQLAALAPYIEYLAPRLQDFTFGLDDWTPLVPCYDRLRSFNVRKMRHLKTLGLHVNNPSPGNQGWVCAVLGTTNDGPVPRELRQITITPKLAKAGDFRDVSIDWSSAWEYFSDPRITLNFAHTGRLPFGEAKAIILEQFRALDRREPNDRLSGPTIAIAIINGAD